MEQGSYAKKVIKEIFGKTVINLGIIDVNKNIIGCQSHVC